MENILTLKDVCVSYDKKTVLKDINLNIVKNKITAIIGPSGCGKSTLLKTINLMVLEEEGCKLDGEIYLNNKNLKDINVDDVRKQIGLVFQNPTPFPFSIYKNMTYGPLYYGIRDKKTLNGIVKNKLTFAGLYDEIENDIYMNASKLSGGQQQRLCIARALTVEPKVLLLDEPCSALDIINTSKIEEMLKELSKKYTVVIVTHNLSQAKRISDYTAFILNGRLVEYGSTKSLFDSPNDKRTMEYIQGIYG